MSVNHAFLALCALLFVSTAACGESSGGSGGGDISIGASVPLTGDFAVYGQDYVRGAQVAIDEINKAGGVDGRKLKLIKDDDGGTATQAVSVAHKLVDSDVSAVIGPEITSQALAADPIYARANLATFVVASGDEIAQQGYKNIFQISYRNADAGPYDAKTLYDKLGARKVYIITDGSTYAVGLAKEMKKAFTAAGGEIVGTGQIAAGDNDYTAALARAKASGADHFYYPAYPQEAAKLVKQGAGVGIESHQWVLGGAAFDPSLIKIAGAAANGIVVSGTAAPPQLLPAAQHYVKAYKAKFNTDPSLFGQWAYDNIKFLAAVFKNVKDPGDRDQVVKGIHALQDFKGISGPVAFRANGERTVVPLSTLTVKNGNFELYQQ